MTSPAAPQDESVPVFSNHHPEGTTELAGKFTPAARPAPQDEQHVGLEVCPHDGKPLYLCAEPDGNEDGVWMHRWFSCSPDGVGGHTFRAEPDGVGGFFPVNDDDDAPPPNETLRAAVGRYHAIQVEEER